MSATLQSSGLGERQAFELVRKLVELRVLVGLMNASVLWPSALYRRSPLHLVTHILQLRGGYLCADALRALGPAARCGRPYAGKICEFARMPCCHNLHCNEACQRLLLILQITSSPGIHIQRFISALETRCALTHVTAGAAPCAVRHHGREGQYDHHARRAGCAGKQGCYVPGCVVQVQSNLMAVVHVQLH